MAHPVAYFFYHDNFVLQGSHKAHSQLLLGSHLL